MQIAPDLFRTLMPEDEGESKAKKGKGNRPRSGALDGFDMAEPISEEEALQMDLEKVKAEREKLLIGIAATKEEVGTAGGEAQEVNIKQLRQEIAMKKAKVNDMRLEAARKEVELKKRQDENTDCELLTPDGAGAQMAYIEALKAEAENLIVSLEDADAKNRLYQILSDRTKYVAALCWHAQLACCLPTSSRFGLACRCLRLASYTQATAF